MHRRIILLVIIILSIAYFPWWVGGLIALVAIWRFESSYELAFPAFLVDLIYGTPIFAPLQFAFPTTLLLLVIITLNKLVVKQFFFRSS